MCGRGLYVCRYRGVFACVLDDEEWQWRACDCATSGGTGIVASLLTLRRHRLSPRHMWAAANDRVVLRLARNPSTRRPEHVPNEDFSSVCSVVLYCAHGGSRSVAAHVISFVCMLCTPSLRACPLRDRLPGSHSVLALSGSVVSECIVRLPTRVPLGVGKVWLCHFKVQCTIGRPGPTWCWL